MLDANASPNSSRIHFAIPGGDAVHVISPATPLPPISAPVEILGSTQPGFASSPVISLDGSATGRDAHGIHIQAGGCRIDGLAVGGFSGGGIVIEGTGGSSVERCWIGTGGTAGDGAGNGLSGVSIADSPDNTIGGRSFTSGNVIAGNGGAGISISGAGSRGNRILGNWIGSIGGDDLSGPGNAGAGVEIRDGASDNTVGDVDPGEANVIAFNAAGVRVAGDGSNGNRIRRNAILANAGLGIDLGETGSDANDAGDADTGANGLQNAPLLTSATLDGDRSLFIEGALESEADSGYEIDLYASLPGDGGASGRFHLGSVPVMTEGTTASFHFLVERWSPELGSITATATRSAAPLDTSEFSAPFSATATAVRFRRGDANADGFLDVADPAIPTGTTLTADLCAR